MGGEGAHSGERVRWRPCRQAGRQAARATGVHYIHPARSTGLSLASPRGAAPNSPISRHCSHHKAAGEGRAKTPSFPPPHSTGPSGHEGKLGQAGPCRAVGRAAQHKIPMRKHRGGMQLASGSLAGASGAHKTEAMYCARLEACARSYGSAAQKRDRERRSTQGSREGRQHELQEASRGCHMDQ